MKFGWLGFWFCVSVFVVCDHWVFTLGYESFFQSHKTPEEKEMQRIILEKMKK